VTFKYRIVEERMSYGGGYRLGTFYCVQYEDEGRWHHLEKFEDLQDARDFLAFHREFPDGKVVE
jgi:hypothetical protein